MTHRQKIIIGALAIANVAVILALTTTVRRSLDTLSPPPSATPPQTIPAATPATETPAANPCQWEAARLLAQAGLGGAVTLTPDGTLHLDLAYSLPADQTAQDAAQLVWVAFDVALALEEQAGTCTSLARIEVTILAQSSSASTRITAVAGAADLRDYDAGEIDQAQFIERVAYTVHDLQTE
jgi:hypothetical protein